MLDDNVIKEALSFSYVRTISYYAGYSAGKPEYDYGIDLTIKDIEKRPSGRTFESGIRLDAQLKSTVTFQETASEIIYDLRNKNYNDLIITSSATPRILVLLCLPREKGEWVKQDVDSLIMKKCAFWKYLGGLPSVPDTESTTTINISKLNVFSVEHLKRIMDAIKDGRDIGGI
jgi:hypothetical protein